MSHRKAVQSLAEASASDLLPTLVRERVIGQRRKVWDKVLKVKVSPQLDEPPGTTSPKFLLGKKAQRHRMKVSIDFSKE
jgi:hypothetical protein